MNLHPKVRVPAIVGTIITVALSTLAALSDVPKVAAYAAAGVTILNTLSGYLTYAD